MGRFTSTAMAATLVLICFLNILSLSTAHLQGGHTTFTIKEPQGNTYLSHMLRLMATKRKFSEREHGKSPPVVGENIIHAVLEKLTTKKTNVYTKSDKIDIIKAAKHLIPAESVKALST